MALLISSAIQGPAKPGSLIDLKVVVTTFALGPPAIRLPSPRAPY
ncbi:hypothetical protein [Streptomyces sp. NPDC007883]